MFQNDLGGGFRTQLRKKKRPSHKIFGRNRYLGRANSLRQSFSEDAGSVIDSLRALRTRFRHGRRRRRKLHSPRDKDSERRGWFCSDVEVFLLEAKRTMSIDESRNDGFVF